MNDLTEIQGLVDSLRAEEGFLDLECFGSGGGFYHAFYTVSDGEGFDAEVVINFDPHETGETDLFAISTHKSGGFGCPEMMLDHCEVKGRSKIVPKLREWGAMPSIDPAKEIAWKMSLRDEQRAIKERLKQKHGPDFHWRDAAPDERDEYFAIENVCEGFTLEHITTIIQVGNPAERRYFRWCLSAMEEGGN